MTKSKDTSKYFYMFATSHHQVAQEKSISSTRLNGQKHDTLHSGSTDCRFFV